MPLENGPDNLDSEGRTTIFLEGALQMVTTGWKMGDLYNYLYSLDPETRKEQLAMLQQAIELLANIHDVKNRIPRGSAQSSVDTIKNQVRKLQGS